MGMDTQINQYLVLTPQFLALLNHCTIINEQKRDLKLKIVNKKSKIDLSVLGPLLIHSLVPSHRSLICLLRTARFARALRCAHSFARSFTRSLRSLWEICFCLRNEHVDFISFERLVPTFPVAAGIKPKTRTIKKGLLFKRETMRNCRPENGVGEYTFMTGMTMAG